MGNDKQYPGRIDILRPTRGAERFIQMRLEDEGSRCVVIDIRMTMEDFGNAITGLGNTPCKFQLLGVKQVGKRVEHKAVEVFVPDGTSDTRSERIRVAVVAYEKDGWRGDDNDAQNWHRAARSENRGTWYNVQYTRFVDIEEDDSE